MQRKLEATSFNSFNFFLLFVLFVFVFFPFFSLVYISSLLIFIFFSKLVIKIYLKQYVMFLSWLPRVPQIKWAICLKLDPSIQCVMFCKFDQKAQILFRDLSFFSKYHSENFVFISFHFIFSFIQFSAYATLSLCKVTF